MGMFTTEQHAELKKTVDDFLDQVCYSNEFNVTYQPTPFALNYVNFIKMVNGNEGEQHPSPVVHLRMLDKLAGPKKLLANLCSRGLAKTTLFFEYLVFYVAIFEGIEGFSDDISGMIYVSDSMENGVKSARKNIEHRYYASEFLQHWLPKAHFTDNYIEFENRNGHKLGIKMFGAKTGLRGTKIFGKRPVLAILDDLVSDDDSKSKAAMEAIKDTIYKGVFHALDPVKRKIVFNGTPFNKNDILYEAVESGAWEVNVWPVCERFPCTREEFNGAWPERFDYDFVLEQYEAAKKVGRLASFLQELMLRITSDEDRLILPQEIRWYSRAKLMENRSAFNFYITSDWATSDKQHADWTVITVWALNNAGQWFWVDGIRHQKTMDVSINELFDLVAKYRPMNVGVEVTGQQGGFIPWMQEKMFEKNCYFTFATNGNNNAPGIRPATDKLTRFQLAVPLFKEGKILLPEEGRTTGIIQAFVDEISMATPLGFKSKNDDCADNISQLPLLKAWRPSEQAQVSDSTGLWGKEEEADTGVGMSNYVV